MGLGADSDEIVVEAYRAAYDKTRDIVAAYRVAESVFRNLHPEIATPSDIRGRVATLIGLDILASHRRIWDEIVKCDELPEQKRDAGGSTRR
jgi:hypothetical protein